MTTTQTAPTITYRKTKAGQWIAYGPVTAITAGAIIRVSKRSGETKLEQIASVGRPFEADGQQMVYGYLAPPRPAATSRTPAARDMCDECGERAAVTTAYDMSGIPGHVCGRCRREGFLSFS
jgi:hypothetical protein